MIQKVQNSGSISLTNRLIILYFAGKRAIPALYRAKTKREKISNKLSSFHV
jgi:hypothetical protein